MIGCCDQVGVKLSRIDSFWGNLVTFGGLTALNGDAFWPSSNLYCLPLGPKGRLLNIEGAKFVLVGSRHVCYGQLVKTILVSFLVLDSLKM